ncbi:MAG: 50S ribosomal protein L24 [Acidobacteria bacterium]|nr:50S ribosomal protein L24 [Acidobacteriota bacterium]
MAKVRIKKNDTVLVRAGKDRGKRGRVLQVMPDKGRVVVEGIGLVKRHTRPNPQKNIKGGILTRESAIHVSNVMLVDAESNQPARMGVRVEADGAKVRVRRKRQG